MNDKKDLKIVYTERHGVNVLKRKSTCLVKYEEQCNQVGDLLIDGHAIN